MSLPRTLFLFVLLLSTSLNSLSQNAGFPQDSIAFRPEVERQFVDAMRFFTGGRFDTAAVLFTKSIREFPRSHRATGAYIMGAKAYYRLGNFRESVRFLKDLIDLYPDSRYLADAHYTLGLDFYRMARYDEASREFLQSFQLASDIRLRARSQGMLEAVTRVNMSIAQLQLLMPDATTDEMKALIDLRIAEKVYASGDIRSAQDLLRAVSARSPSIKYVGEALTLLQKYEKGGILKVGVVLPLMLKSETSSARDLGVEMLDGIRVAVEEYNEEFLPRVELDIRDSDRDPSVAARQVTELCNDDKIVSILGPVFSNEAFASAGIANARGVPLITPTATANGISAIGGFVFQANPDYEVRGRGMARFAIQQLKDSMFAVLSPIEPPGKLMADAFVDEVKLLGGEVIDVQWYQAGATDLRTQLETMRRKALEKATSPSLDFSKRIKHSDVNKMVIWGASQQLLDSLMEVGGAAPVDLIFGRNGKQIADSLGLETQMPVIRSDSLGLPVTNIQAMFIPIASSDEIGVVGSQIKLFNFQTRILGTGEWQEPAELDQHRQYVDGVVFSTDSFWDERSQTFKTFSAKFQKTTNKKPTKNILYGYDAMKALLSVIQQGSSYKSEIAANLTKLRDYPGIHSRVTFSERRVNSHLTILQYKGRTIRRIGEVDVSTPIPQQP